MGHGRRRLVARQESYLLDGRSTNTHREKASLLLEEYVRRLAVLVGEAHTTEEGERPGWVGYEYWVQRVKPTETPAFHYDKDEAMSSLERKFIYPDVSSIFYIRWGVVHGRCHSYYCHL